ncbi:Arm DNA-binding domain-containing protein [Vannielia litorea]|uniref:tyrosine-type recombinase/integrase n=1 Tax=Vannielia litorea TaxID=1217970 RepID=UPI001C943BF8|nr:integrase arm-type DNA-binding domain-containing protein [Vannielia litorea]MBY6153359.1 Arm DNA-binding domain-containing protein [Vannielia litorea]
MPLIKLTQTAVKELEAAPEKQLLFRDTEVRGLALRVTPNGHKTFVFGYSVNGRERRMRIGDASTCTVVEAREAAKKLRREVDYGSAPQEQRSQKASAPSMRELWDAFQTDHFPDISEKYRREQVSYWYRHVLPAFGKLKVADLSRQNVVVLHRKIAEGAPTLANRVLASIRKALSYAITRGWIQDNVASKVKQKRETVVR